MTSHSASSPTSLRVRSLLVAGLAVAAVSAVAPVVTTSVLPTTTATTLDPVQDRDLLVPEGSLATTLTDPARRTAVVDRLTDAVGATANEEGGIVARSLAAASGGDPAAARALMDRQLVGYANALQPQWDAYKATGASGDFGRYLADRAPAVGTALLSVSDRFAAASASVGARVTYNLARLSAADSITAALPQMGTIVEDAMR
ncbi:DUF6918 family protein [Actinomycetospora chiangmaiensis]|uniref:DUF6918 family protein n=1 Tax=Actinomycetospora chiangmaiensis TaxID=402650 RepID=UPI003CCBACF0